jgi:hypothetical protein
VDARRQLSLDPSPSDQTISSPLRDDLAAAILNAARMGERNPSTLSAIATSFGLRKGIYPSDTGMSVMFFDGKRRPCCATCFLKPALSWVLA